MNAQLEYDIKQAIEGLERMIPSYSKSWQGGVINGAWSAIKRLQEQVEELSRICSEAYQVVGALADPDNPKSVKILDNLSQLKMVHEDVLPYLLKSSSAQDAPVAWRIELECNQWFTDDLDEACDDLTNHNAKAVPLFESHPSTDADKVRDQALEEAQGCCDLVTAFTGHQSKQAYSAALAISRMIGDLK